MATALNKQFINQNSTAQKIDQQSQFHTPERFPNHFNDLKRLARSNHDIQLIQGYIQSTLERIKILHIHNNELENNNFFAHLREKLTQELNNANADFDISLFIGGKSVRALLASMYELIHERQLAAPSKDVKDIKHSPVQGHDPEIVKAKKSMLFSSEFHLQQATLGYRDELLAPMVFGSDNDIDIHFSVKTKDGQPLSRTQAQKAAAVIARINDYVKQIQNSHTSTNALSKNLLPRISITAVPSPPQGLKTANPIDEMLFNITNQQDTAEKGKVCHFNISPKDKKTLRDFINGLFVFTDPINDAVAIENSLSSIVTLFQLPFIRLSNESQLTSALYKLGQKAKSGKLTIKDWVAVGKYYKNILLNAKFRGAANRPYGGKCKPTKLALDLADISSQTAKNNFPLGHLMPEYLPSMKIKHETNLKGDIKVLRLIPFSDFKQKYTDNGSLYHGTSMQGALNILRGGPVLSTMKAGAAMFGTGMYSTPSFGTAALYAGSDGIVFDVKVKQNPNVRIIDGQFIQNNYRSLLNEAKNKGFYRNGDSNDDTIARLLRDRDQYAIDVIINQHVIIQNEDVIDIDKNLYTHFDNTIRRLAANLGGNPHHADTIHCLNTLRLLISLGCDKEKIKQAGQYLNHYTGKASVLSIPNAIIALMIEAGFEAQMIKLIDRGYSIHSIFGGSTLLHQAVIKGQKDLAAYLIHKGANMFNLDSNGKTPLDYATSEFKVYLDDCIHSNINQILRRSTTRI